MRVVEKLCSGPVEIEYMSYRRSCQVLPRISHS